MALRNLVTKMRTPTAAAFRLPSAPRVSPPAGSRALASSNSSKRKYDVKDFYLGNQQLYADATRQLASFRSVLKRRERVVKFFTWTYRLGVPLVVGSQVLSAIDAYQAVSGDK